ncbi:hypothetical protein C8J57DRAFT_1338307 [Mycena rebaudengoi]|nr:hypothetical protein C8J57DRAFT_1338307 [Mycena rebaudengoi]
MEPINDFSDLHNLIEQAYNEQFPGPAQAIEQEVILHTQLENPVAVLQFCPHDAQKEPEVTFFDAAEPPEEYELHAPNFDIPVIYRNPALKPIMATLPIGMPLQGPVITEKVFPLSNDPQDRSLSNPNLLGTGLIADNSCLCCGLQLGNKRKTRCPWPALSNLYICETCTNKISSKFLNTYPLTERFDILVRFHRNTDCRACHRPTGPKYRTFTIDGVLCVSCVTMITNDCSEESGSEAKALYVRQWIYSRSSFLARYKYLEPLFLVPGADGVNNCPMCKKIFGAIGTTKATRIDFWPGLCCCKNCYTSLEGFESGLPGEAWVAGDINKFTLRILILSFIPFTEKCVRCGRKPQTRFMMYNMKYACEGCMTEWRWEQERLDVYVQPQQRVPLLDECIEWYNTSIPHTQATKCDACDKIIPPDGGRGLVPAPAKYLDKTCGVIWQSYFQEMRELAETMSSQFLYRIWRGERKILVANRNVRQEAFGSATECFFCNSELEPCQRGLATEGSIAEGSVLCRRCYKNDLGRVACARNINSWLLYHDKKMLKLSQIDPNCNTDTLLFQQVRSEAIIVSTFAFVYRNHWMRCPVLGFPILSAPGARYRYRLVSDHDHKLARMRVLEHTLANTINPLFDIARDQGWSDLAKFADVVYDYITSRDAHSKLPADLRKVWDSTLAAKKKEMGTPVWTWKPADHDEWHTQVMNTPEGKRFSRAAKKDPSLVKSILTGAPVGKAVLCHDHGHEDGEAGGWLVTNENLPLGGLTGAACWCARNEYAGSDPAIFMPIFHRHVRRILNNLVKYVASPAPQVDELIKGATNTPELVMLLNKYDREGTDMKPLVDAMTDESGPLYAQTNALAEFMQATPMTHSEQVDRFNPSPILNPTTGAYPCLSKSPGVLRFSQGFDAAADVVVDTPHLASVVVELAERVEQAVIDDLGEEAEEEEN